MKPKLWRKHVRRILNTDTNVGSDISRLIVSYVTYSKYNEKLYHGITPKEIPYSAIECDWSAVAADVCCNISPRWSFLPACKVLRIANCSSRINPILCVRFACDVCNGTHNGWCKPNSIVLDGVVYLTIETRCMKAFPDYWPIFTVAIL